MIFETHAHLDFFANNSSIFDKICSDCFKKNIPKIVVPPISFNSNFVISDLIKGYNNIYQVIGLHPKEAINTILTNNRKNQLLNLYKESTNIVAIKTGLDFSKTKLQEAQIKNQIDAFKKLTIMAAELNLALVLHIRDAWEIFCIEWEEIFTNSNLKIPQTVVHCYNERNVEETKYSISQNINFFGIGGKIFTDSILRATVQELPLEHIVLETDSPYLKPNAYTPPEYVFEYEKKLHKKVKGLNTPQSLPLIAGEIANIKGIPVEDVIEQTYKNAMELFCL